MEQFFGTDVWHKLVSESLLYLPRVVIALVMFGLFWGTGAIMKKVVQSATKLRKLNLDVVSLVGSLVKGALMTVGAVMALGTLGIDVTAMVAGVGLTGFALSFALKDIISNALAGLIVLIYEPFRRTDRISVTSLEGTVSQITLRYTTLDTGDKEILIPNSNLLTNPIVVFRTTLPSVQGDVQPNSPSAPVEQLIAR